MLHPDELERLSQFEAGELDATQAAALRQELAARPELAAALEQLRGLVPAVEALRAEGLVSAEDRAAVARVRLVAAAPRPWRLPLVLAAGVAAGVLAAVLVLSRGTSAPDRAPSPEALRPAPLELQPGAALATADEGRAFATSAGAWLLGPHSRVEVEDAATVALVQGSAVLSGRLLVKVGGDAVRLDGTALVSTEPPEAVAHVTPLVTRTGDLQMTRMLEGVRFPEAATVAVLLLAGQAWPASASAPLSPGQQWCGPATPVASAPPPAPAPAATADRPGEPEVVKALPNRDAVVGGHLLKPFEMVDLPRVNQAAMQSMTELLACVPRDVEPLAEPKRLDARLTWKAQGGSMVVAEVAAGDSTTLNPIAAGCVLGVLRQTRWPAPVGAELLELSYPLTFLARGETGVTVVLPRLSRDRTGLELVPDRAGVVEVPVGASPTQGPADAKVTVVVFTEATCSFCLKGWASLAELRRSYAGRPVRFVFKHRAWTPDGLAYRAALALEAARQQGQFWEFADRLFATEASSDAALLNLALGLGLDAGRFQAALSAPETRAAVEADLALAGKLGVTSAPCTFINGREFVGARPTDTYVRAIDQALQQAR